MPETRKQSSSELEKYDAMRTEELQKLLREDASKPEGEEANTEVIFYVMEVLARRRKEQNEGKTPEEALASFKRNYSAEDEVPFVPDTFDDPEKSPAGQKQRIIGRWKRGLIAAAAVLVIIAGGSLTARAMGVDLWGMVARWTQETFHFGHASAPSVDYDKPCASLQEALGRYDISSAIVPTWLPDGYMEDRMEITETPRHRAFKATYAFDDRTIVIRIGEYLESNPMQIEQSEELLETYTSNGVDYYIFKNNSILEAVWINENFECYISGPLSISEIEKVIDSIAKG